MHGIFPDTVAIGANSFWGAGAYTDMLDPEPLKDSEGMLQIKTANFSENTFMGNYAMIEAGSYPTDSMYGVGSYIPAGLVQRRMHGERDKPQTLFGVPPLQFPNRGKILSDPEKFAPTLFEFLQRVFLSDILPKLALGLIGLVAWFHMVGYVQLLLFLGDYHEITQKYGIITQFRKYGLPPFPIMWASMLIVMISLPTSLLLIGVSLKWLICGRTKPGTYRMWDAAPALHFIGWCLQKFWKPATFFLRGTLAENMVWRALGATIGARVQVIGWRYSDMNMLDIGDDVTVQHPCWQLHTFEDRCLRVGPTNIGKRSSDLG